MAPPARARRAIRLCDERVVAERVVEARSLAARLRGLLGRDTLPPGDGMWIEPCNSIHTLFMRFPIDAVFVSADGTVTAIAHELGPWRLTRIHGAAVAVLELPAGRARSVGLVAGDRISLVP